MGDELIESKVHLAAMRIAEPRAVVVDPQIEMDAMLLPCVTELVGCDRDGREAG